MSFFSAKICKIQTQANIYKLKTMQSKAETVVVYFIFQTVAQPNKNFMYESSSIQRFYPYSKVVGSLCVCMCLSVYGLMTPERLDRFG